MKNINFISRESLHNIVCVNIKRYREAEGITQLELAEKIEISHEYLRQLESKKGQKDFNFYTLYKISKVLNVPIDKFLVINSDE